MKIAASTLEWQAEHSASRTESHSASLRSWSGQRPADAAALGAALPAGGQASNAAGQAGAALVRSSLQISQEARRLLREEGLQAGSAVDRAQQPLWRSELSPLQSMISQLIEHMTGVGANLIRVEAGAAQAQPLPTDSEGRALASAAQAANWGLEYDEHHVLEESESTRWAAQGTIRTADGREVSFSIELQMQRHFRQESNTSLRLGNARPIDPLVINFDGTAAELQDVRFAFDLDSDGHAEQVPLLAGNRGFLALDRNGNQRIDNGSELFGPGTGNGFAELAAYDDDGNGWIDENDQVFDKLRVWTPSADGPGTLRSLREVGVGAISLAAAGTEFALRTADNRSLGQVRATSAYLYEDGRVGHVQQLDLSV